MAGVVNMKLVKHEQGLGEVKTGCTVKNMKMVSQVVNTRLSEVPTWESGSHCVSGRQSKNLQPC